MLAWLVVLALGTVSSVRVVEPAPQLQPERTPLTRLRVSAGELDAETLAAELRLRVPELRVEPYVPAEGPLDPSSAFVSVDHPPSDPRLQITIITADGSGWVRVVEPVGVASERTVAIEVANLLEAIAIDAAAPDIERAELPQSAEQERESPPPAEVAAAKVSRPRTDVQTPEPTSPSSPRPGLDVGVGLRSALPLGLGPPPARERIAAGGAVGATLRWPVGAVLDVDLRAAGRQARGLSLARFRIAVGAGYGLRYRGFDLITTLLLSVEPWFPPADLRRSAGGAASPGPLLGVALRASPAWITQPLGRRGIRVRVGARIELAGSGSPDAGLGVPRIAAATAPDTFLLRVGGLELDLAAEVGIVIPIAASRATR